MCKIFLDSSDLKDIRELKDRVAGFTTNPSIMRKAGVTDYEKFCKEVLAETDKPVSFEVFANDIPEMARQARIISTWGDNVYVKIPVTTTTGEPCYELARELLDENIKVNLTAVLSRRHLARIEDHINGSTTPHIISLFCGRMADTGVDPMLSVAHFKERITGELLWASPREVLNIYQAEEYGADIITVTPELFRKYEKMKEYDLNQLSLDTIRMFHDDAKASGFRL